MPEFSKDITSSPLYSEDLAPIPASKRTWGLWDMTAIWVGMAVCIPTYLLASYMIKSGLNWVEALVIIALGNLIITIPMVLNGHPGVKYGIPFPVIGRASFGIRGIHIAAVVRGIVACGWFGIQTWIGGLAFYAIWHAFQGSSPAVQLDVGKFVGFGLFWLLNVYFIWKGTESIKWLEKFAAPILLAIGVLLIIWGVRATGNFQTVLKQSKQLGQSTALLEPDAQGINLNIYPIAGVDGRPKASEYRIQFPGNSGLSSSPWLPIDEDKIEVSLDKFLPASAATEVMNGSIPVEVILRRATEEGNTVVSSAVPALPSPSKSSFWNKIWSYLLWLTAMVGFWATMAISIADITRFTATQRNQVLGQFLGLPGTMALFSFVGIFVTCAAVVVFPDVLVASDAPWDPVSLIGKFDQPTVVIIAQIFMIIATLSTNIAANVIAPANAFSNMIPSRISFRAGGILTALIGIIICPWWILDEISNLLLFVSGFLGPVLAILIADYYLIRKKQLKMADLFSTDGEYSFGGSGYNQAAMIALAGGVLIALIGLIIPALSFLYTLSWFTGFGVAFGLYWWLMSKPSKNEPFSAIP